MMIYSRQQARDRHSQSRIEKPVIIPIQCGQQASGLYP